jgi:hypothetical protein
MWLTDIAHHHLAIGVVFIFALAVENTGAARRESVLRWEIFL